ncbi:MAG TPA: TonB-dependent siderophore receptor [Thermoanaerobaculia bacterium]|nr:TonB-dependent siderophore receptor [Thermoanaerobaculia bacterium]
MLGRRRPARLARLLTIACLLAASAGARAEAPDDGASASAAGAAAGRTLRIAFEARVVDISGQPISGARVIAVPVSGGAAVAVAESRLDGRFSLAVPAGRYAVQVELDGFGDVTREVAVEANAAPAADFVLAVTSVRESITVEAEPGYRLSTLSSATRTPTPLRDVPQSVTVVTRQLMQDQLMTNIADVVRYLPGVQLHQGENNRDQVIIRGNSSSADFFVDGVRDDVQYYRDLYNLDRVEALKGSNAMIFGRGGGGGVINRVTKQAGFGAGREVTLQASSHDGKRVTADVDERLSDALALRVNGVFEDSASFRDGVDLQRSGIAPTMTWRRGDATKLTLGFEHFQDRRVADRGITSFQGRPADVPIETFYGNSDDSKVRALVNLGSAVVEHQLGGLALRNRTLFGDYDRFYQNYVPGAASADMTKVTLTAYNNATQRQNLFNQTDLTYAWATGSVRHNLLFGAEVGRQETDNFRNTGFFDNSATSILVPFDAPQTRVPVTYRQNATDADNHLEANVAALYAQDQVELSQRVQLVAGLRFDRFDLDYHNQRNGDRIGRTDDLVSPRAGVIVKPIAPLSLYGTYSVSYLPSSGDQFSSLTAVTKQLEPEEFVNYEVGAKWDATDALALTVAAYRLDRTNTRSTDPNDPTRIVQTGSQRTEGWELGVNGQLRQGWSVAGGYAYQDAVVTSATASAREGAVVGQVPRHTLSLWNNWQLRPGLSAALGIVHRTKMFATIDNTVTLPGYTRVDAAAYFTVLSNLRLQVNVENVLDDEYWANADSNTNLSPGSPRAFHVGLSARF